jgi:CHAD domain-containing protein
VANLLYTYADIRKQEIEHLLQAPPNLIDRGWLHDTRVGIKRCKAIYELLNSGNKSFSKAFPALQRLFKNAGEIRELQVVQKKLEDLPAMQNAEWLLSALSHREDLLLTRFLHHKATRMQPLAQELEFLLQLVSKVATAQQQNKVVLALQNIYRVLQLPYHQDLHLLRRQVKWIMYQCEASGWVSHSKARTVFLLGINRLQSLLGHWHDWQVALHQIPEHTRAKQPVTCMLIRQQILLKQSSLKNEINFQIRDCRKAMEKTRLAMLQAPMASAEL